MKNLVWARVSPVVVLMMLFSNVAVAQLDMVVSNVVAELKPFTSQVDVTYDLATFGYDDGFNDNTIEYLPVSISMYLSIDGGANYEFQCQAVSGDVGAGIMPATGLKITWDAGVDFPGFINETCRFRVIAEVPTYTVSGTLTLPEPVVDKPWYVAVDVDGNGENGMLGWTEGVVTGSSVSYTIENIPVGDYYIYSEVDLAGNFGPWDCGDYVGSGCWISGWESCTVAISSDVTVDMDLLVNDEGCGSDGFVLIPPESVSMPATFTMGSDVYSNDETPHQVTLTGRFHIASTEVTNGQYMAALQWAYDQGHVTATSSSVRDNLDGSTVELLDLDDSDCQISFSSGVFSTSFPLRPVIEVSWFGSVSYCDWLSLQDGLPRAYDHGAWSCNSGNPYMASGYRLPTEAEWEFACRAGTTTHFNSGDCLDSGTEANYNGDFPFTGCPSGPYLGRTTDVGSYPANQWGLFDIHGNVFEWCNDWYGSYNGDETDPEGAGSGNYRVLRGGNWYYNASVCRSASRSDGYPFYTYVYYGFRPVRSAH